MKNAKDRVKIHTPYIICNDMMYNTWEEIADVYKRQVVFCITVMPEVLMYHVLNIEL